ncbi:MAG: hypothetical protein AB1942_20115 [Pseudomonadota bacterium]
MAAAIAERLRKARSGDHLNLAVKANAQIFRGCMVMALAGVAVAARAAVSRAELDTILVVGLAVDSALGGGADGDVRVEIERADVYCLANGAGGDALTVADVGDLCFAIDDQTVGKTTGGGVRPIAGKVVDVDGNGVWVDFRFAREPRRLYLPFAISEVDTLAGTSAELVSPVVGAITQLQTEVQKAVTTGGDVTAAVGVTAVAGLACTVADGAAKGAIVTDTPTAGDATTVVAVGSRIQVVPAAAFNGAGAVSGLVEVTF